MEKIFELLKKPCSLQELAKKLGIKKNQISMLKKTMRRFEAEGKITYKNGKYSTCSQAGLIEGTVCSTASGADFFISPDLESDLLITHSRSFCLMHGDKVLVKPKGTSCTVIKLLERANTSLVGTVCAKGIFVPDSKKFHADFVIPKSQRAKANIGDKVVVQIVSYPTVRTAAVCKIEENLGSSQSSDAAILSVLRTYNIQETFPNEVLNAALILPDSVPSSALNNRLDLRKIKTITIDGDDSKDFDDAVSLEMTERGDYLLGVHIADVAYYVKQNDIIDKEAQKRGTSVYIPGAVFPMLPQKLSNGICSLNEGVDRLTLSCFMIYSRQGKLIEYSIQPSVINSSHRMTYNEVTQLLEDKKTPLKDKYKDVYGMLVLMKSLAEILISCAQKRGCIDFDLPEAKFSLDENGIPKKIEPYSIGISNRIIEQFMLAANQAVATFMNEHALPCLYRVHQAPEEKKLSAFSSLLSLFELSLPDVPKPADFRSLLANVKDAPYEALIQKVALRTMSKAKYMPQCVGHYGLAMENYLHFTSPIRRYPDLVVHRVLHMYFEKDLNAIEKYAPKMGILAQSTTESEINAAACERDVDDIFKAMYMESHIGEEFDAVVSGVTSFGIFAQLENTVEGYIPLKTINAYFEYNENTYSLYCREKNFKLTLGDSIRVKAVSTNIPSGETEFSLLVDF